MGLVSEPFLPSAQHWNMYILFAEQSPFIWSAEDLGTCSPIANTYYNPPECWSNYNCQRTGEQKACWESRYTFYSKKLARSLGAWIRAEHRGTAILLQRQIVGLLLRDSAHQFSTAVTLITTLASASLHRDCRCRVSTQISVHHTDRRSGGNSAHPWKQQGAWVRILFLGGHAIHRIGELVDVQL